MEPPTKRPRANKKYALVNLGFEIIEVDSIESGQIETGSRVVFLKPGKMLSGMICGLSSKKSNLIAANEKHVPEYISDDEDEKNQAVQVSANEEVDRSDVCQPTDSRTANKRVCSAGSIDSSFTQAGDSSKINGVPESSSQNQKIATDLSNLVNGMDKTVQHLQRIDTNSALTTKLMRALLNALQGREDSASDHNSTDCWLDDASADDQLAMCTTNEIDSQLLEDNTFSGKNESSSNGRIIFPRHLVDVPFDPDESYLPAKQVERLQNVARSRSHFAQLLVETSFSPQERFGATISGVNGYRKLDDRKMNWIIRLAFTRYPIMSSEGSADQQWVKCRNIIDTKLRRKTTLLNETSLIVKEN